MFCKAVITHKIHKSFIPMKISGYMIHISTADTYEWKFCEEYIEQYTLIEQSGKFTVIISNLSHFLFQIMLPQDADGGCSWHKVSEIITVCRL